MHYIYKKQKYILHCDNINLNTRLNLVEFLNVNKPLLIKTFGLNRVSISIKGKKIVISANERVAVLAPMCDSEYSYYYEECADECVIEEKQKYNKDKKDIHIMLHNLFLLFTKNTNSILNTIYCIREYSVTYDGINKWCATDELQPFKIVI